MAINWVRWYHGTAADPKWRAVARKSGQPLTAVIAVWAMILETASAASERGTLEGFDPEVVGAALDLDPEQVTAIVEAMQGKVLDGDRLPAWDKRNPKREDNSADRVRRYRERRRAEREAETVVVAPVTQCNAGETLGNAPDEDRDTERDINTPPSSPPRAHTREGDLDRLRSYLGPHAEAADRFAEAADHSATWAAAILGLYGPSGTDPTIWQRSPPVPEADRPALLARALDRYAGEGHKYDNRYFRRFLEAVIDEHERDGGARANGRRPAAASGGAAPRPAALGAGDPSRRSGWVYE